MELIHGSLLLSMVVYGIFGFCAVGGIFGIVGTGFRIKWWYEESKLIVVRSTRLVDHYKRATIVWAAFTIALWGVVIALDMYIL